MSPKLIICFFEIYDQSNSIVKLVNILLIKIAFYCVLKFVGELTCIFASCIEIEGA